MSDNTFLRWQFICKIGQLTGFAELKGIKFIHPHDGYVRTAEQQYEHFKAGKSQCDGYKIKSNHQFDIARDFCAIKLGLNGLYEITWDEDIYEILGKHWKENLGGKWGGDFSSRDTGHFEL
jgi:hypothetical protein